MPVIDADCHTIETEDTWAFMTGEDARYRPRVLAVEGGRKDSSGEAEALWLYDANFANKRAFPPDKAKVTAAAARMEDMPARFADMDRFGVDIQVLYPTVMLGVASLARRETQIAMCKGYNRWVAAKTAAHRDRLRWVATLPFETMDVALKELEWCAENGACGVMMHGLLRDRTVVDDYFFPVYSAAEALNLPITIHSGLANHSFEGIFHSRATGIWNSKFPVIASMHALLHADIPGRFPKLRWGFVEAAASWVPYLLTDMTARAQRLGLKGSGGKFSPRDALARNRFYVTCQNEEDLPYIIQWAGEDNLVIGSDYSHVDNAAEFEAIKLFRDREGLSAAQKKKILEDNPAALYGI